MHFLDDRPEYQKYLFIRGFLVTNKRISALDAFPFYGNWEEQYSNGFYFYNHKLTKIHLYSEGDRTMFLCGHCYDPFNMETDECVILRNILPSCNTEAYYEKVSKLTGIYVTGVATEGKIQFHVDASGMQSACYAEIGDQFYISSHPQLIADLCGLTIDPFAQELFDYKWYGRVLGPYLPADMTSYSPVKRIVPSIAYQYDGTLSHHRFWFNKAIKPAVQDEDYRQVIEQAAEILKNNLILISKKWEKPWISLTGGIDSNTTFAAANGVYHRFHAFSYLSAEKEVPDAAAAEKIAGHFQVPFHKFDIPTDSAQLQDYELQAQILNHNSGYAAPLKPNELRKRLVLKDAFEGDVEVKSWVSEAIRAYWYKYFGRKKMPKLSAKLYRNLYKIFIANRTLAHKVDKVFQEYIDKFEYTSIPDCYSAADMHYTEFSWGSWGGMNISDMKYYADITIAYNNRYFLDLLFRVPLEKRISDQHHLDMKKVLNKELYDMNIRVVNLKETKFRAFALNVIFTINRWLPF